MSAEFGDRSGLQGKLSQWLRGRRRKEAGDGGRAEALLLAAAASGLPLGARRVSHRGLPLFL